MKTASASPIAGTVTLDVNAGGSGWYVDPVPGDESEFTNFNAPFRHPAASPATICYRTAIHEIGHCVGIAGPAAGF